MKNLWTPALNKYRIVTHLGVGDETCGTFVVPSPIDNGPLRIIASSGGGWDHVSVSRAKRCPNWPEMDAIKRMFFRDDEVAMQLHVPAAEHISFMDTCLHLWAPQDVAIPLPPAWMVGPRPDQTIEQVTTEGIAAMGDEA